MEWISSLKQHVENEICYSPEFKSHFSAMVDDISAENPDTFLGTLIDRINNAGLFRSRELAKWLARILYRYQEKIKNMELSEIEKVLFLNEIIIGRV
jgi:hypothetical protein